MVQIALHLIPKRDTAVRRASVDLASEADHLPDQIALLLARRAPDRNDGEGPRVQTDPGAKLGAAEFTKDRIEPIVDQASQGQRAVDRKIVHRDEAGSCEVRDDPITRVLQNVLATSAMLILSEFG